MSVTPNDAPRRARGDGYPIEWDGDCYQPVPEWWIAHQGAVEGPDREGPLLYATSYADVGERTLRVRYIHPTRPRCLAVDVPAAETELGIHPLDLTTANRWYSCIRPGHRPVDDVARPAEWQHLRALWSVRADNVPADREALAGRYEP